jgi:hypothetical protein
MSFDNIPEFYKTDAEWEANEGAGHTEYDNLKRQRDAIVARQEAPIRRVVDMLQRVADFNFLLTLDATPTPKAREAYTQLMVDARLALTDFRRARPSPTGQETKDG